MVVVCVFVVVWFGVFVWFVDGWFDCYGVGCVFVFVCCVVGV